MGSVSCLRSIQLETLSMDTGSVSTFDVLISFKVLDIGTLRNWPRTFLRASHDKVLDRTIEKKKFWLGMSSIWVKLFILYFFVISQVMQHEQATWGSIMKHNEHLDDENNLRRRQATSVVHNQAVSIYTHWHWARWQAAKIISRQVDSGLGCVLFIKNQFSHVTDGR